MRMQQNCLCLELYEHYRDVLYGDETEILLAIRGLFKKLWEIILWTVIHIFLASGRFGLRGIEI